LVERFDRVNGVNDTDGDTVALAVEDAAQVMGPALSGVPARAAERVLEDVLAATDSIPMSSRRVR
jgi:hypothetical protein